LSPAVVDLIHNLLKHFALLGLFKTSLPSLLSSFLPTSLLPSKMATTTLPSFLTTFINDLDKMPLHERTTDKVSSMIADLYIANEHSSGMAPDSLMSLLTTVLEVVSQENKKIETTIFVFSNCPLMQAMSENKMGWGELMDKFEAEGFKPKPKKADAPAPLPEDWDLDFPVLKLRKDIWENFPVMCQPLGRGSDGAERHAIVWHRKNFADWRAECDDFFEAMDYEEITTYRLFKCLEASKHWTVEPAQTSQQICVIRMNFTEEAVSAEATPAPTPAPAPTKPAPAEESGWSTVSTVARKPVPSDLPILTRINDITAEFPIVWNNESRPKMSARPGDIISLSVFNRKLREMPPAAAEACLDRLMRALRASSSWRVIRGQGSEFCRLEMA